MRVVEAEINIAHRKRSVDSMSKADKRLFKK